LISTGFARDMYFQGELAIDHRGKIEGLRIHVDTDNGAFFSDAQPTKFKVGLMHSAFACYDIPYGHLTSQGHYTNKAPGGVAYRCSFRVTEAMFFQERLIAAAAQDLGIDPAEFRRINYVREFPWRTTYAQIVTHEIGIPSTDILVQHGDTDNTPFGMGTYASRSTPTAGAATSMASRKVRAKARKLAAHLLEVSEDDLEWELGRFYVRDAPQRGVTIQDCALAAYTNMPDGLEPGLE